MSTQTDLNTIGGLIDTAYTNIVQTDSTLDPFIADANTSLLLHFNGSNGSTVFTDSSNNQLTVTNISAVSPYLSGGNVAVSTSNKKWGNGSAYFDGTSYLTIPDNSFFDFSSSTLFTVECYFYPTNISSSPQALISKDLYGSNYSWSIIISKNEISCYTNNIGADYNFTVSTPSSLQNNTWYHVALTYDGTNQNIFLNGVLLGSKNRAITNNGSTNISIGCGGWNNPNTPFIGYIDELRVLKGVAAYPSSEPTVQKWPTSYVPSPVYITASPVLTGSALSATNFLNSYVTRCGKNVTDTKNLYSFIKGCVDLGIWDNMVCWPMRLGQNAVTGNTVYSLGGYGTYNGTLNNTDLYGASSNLGLPLRGVNGMTFNGMDKTHIIELPVAIGTNTNNIFAYGCGSIDTTLVNTGTPFNRFIDICSTTFTYYANKFINPRLAMTWWSSFSLPTTSNDIQVYGGLQTYQPTSNLKLNQFYTIAGSKQGNSNSVTISGQTTTTPFLCAMYTDTSMYTNARIGVGYNGTISFVALGTQDVPLSTVSAFDTLYKTTLGLGLSAI